VSGDDDGSALVEFVLVGLLLMVPLTYVVLMALTVQSRAYAVVEAARSGARAYVTAPSTNAAVSSVRRAIGLALHDQGVPPGAAVVSISCSRTPCLTPGGTVSVQVSAPVELGWVPSFLGGGRAAIPVSAVHVETVDPFEPARP
jgi:hypothetical protein